MTAPDVSLGNWFLQRSRRTPTRRALTFEGKTSTYAELQERFDRLAAALKAGGVCRGDRVAFIGLNQPAFFDVMFAAARIGVRAPSDRRSSPASGRGRTATSAGPPRSCRGRVRQ